MAWFGWIWVRLTLETWCRPTFPAQSIATLESGPSSGQTTPEPCISSACRSSPCGQSLGCQWMLGKQETKCNALPCLNSTYRRDSSFASRPFRTTSTTTAWGRCRARRRAVLGWWPSANGCSAPSSKWHRWRFSPQKQPLNFILYEWTPRLSVSTLWFSNNGFKNKTIWSKQVGEHIGTVHSLSSLVKDVQRPERAKNEAFLLHIFLMTPWAIWLSVSLHYFLKTKSFFFN